MKYINQIADLAEEIILFANSNTNDKNLILNSILYVFSVINKEILDSSRKNECEYLIKINNKILRINVSIEQIPEIKNKH